MCFFTTLQAQDVNLQLVPNTDGCSSDQYCVNIQARGENGADYLGGSSIRLSYDTLAVYFDGYTEYVNGGTDITIFQTAGSYTSINFDNDQATLNPECSTFNATPYSAHSFDGNITGEILLTIFLDLETIVTADGSEIIFACPSIADAWVDVSTICFDVRDANRGPNFQFVGVQNGPIDQNNIGGTNFNTDSNEPSEKYENGTLSGLNNTYNMVCNVVVNPIDCNDPAACNFDAASTTNTGCVYPTPWYADTDGDGLGDPNNSIEDCDQPDGFVADNTDPCDGTLDACGICNGPGPATWYADNDGDGLGDPLVTQLACTQPAGFVSNSDDTDDSCSGTFDECGVCNGPGPLTWYADTDGDGLGDPNSVVTACTQPAGFVADNTDPCDGTIDACGICDGSGPTVWYADNDGDGLGDPNSVVTACTQPAGFVSNNSDDCDAGVDECGVCGGSGAPTWYEDADGDGLGNPDVSQVACEMPAGFVANNTDDCDGTTDACGVCNGSGPTIWYLDNDGDGLGDPNSSVEACNQPDGYVSDNTDDCDGSFDACGICNGPGPATWYLDNDSDGLGDPNTSIEDCTQPMGYVSNADDTDDNCAGTTDECGVCNGSGPATWYVDNDGDGLGDPAVSIEACVQPSGYVSNSDDTNDSCDGTLDECGVCNGSGPATWYADTDGDGLGDPNNSVMDCSQPAGFVSNSDDDNDNCNGSLDACGVCNGSGPSTWYQDADGDGLGNPAVTLEDCNQPDGYVANSDDDNDGCNGTIDACGVCDGPGLTTWYCDTDGDGLGDPNNSIDACDQPDGTVTNSDDTNDNSIFGCTDATACNFDATATDDDGTCNNDDPGTGNTDICMGDTEVWDAPNCVYIVDVAQVLGCTDQTATNYNADANCDDNTCTFTCEDPGTGNTDICAGNIEAWNATTCEYDIDEVQVLGCTTACATNYNPAANCDDGSCETCLEGCSDMTACNFNPDVTVENNDLCDFGNSDCTDPCAPVSGCTDASACNYNADACVDDNSCDFGDPSSCNTDCTAGDLTEWDATTCSCVVIESVEGCTDASACNYDADANCDNGTCFLVSADCDADPCNTIYGCVDPTACNYDAGATCNADPITGEDPCTYDCGTDGCTDVAACNYDSNATSDDGSCVFIDAGIIATTDNTTTCPGDGIDDLIVATATGTMGSYTFIITDGDATTILAQADDGGFNLEGAPAGTCLIWGIAHDGSLNIPSVFVEDLEGCFALSNSIAVIRQISGCTDPDAVNYDSTAECDDGSCNVATGCTDITACNYDMNADIDDDSCIVLDGGTISTSDETTFCVGDGLADVVNVTTTGSGLAYAYVITDLSAETILGGPTTDPALDFEGAPPGTCLIWGLAYDPDDFSAPTNQVDDLTGCYAFSNQIAVVRQESGCTNIIAQNYNPDAVCDDDSCSFNEGCTDPTACNYNENADIDDGTCIFEQTYYLDNDGDGLGDPNIVLTTCPLPLSTGGFGAPNGYVANSDDDIDIDQFSVIVEITCNDVDKTLTPVVLVEGMIGEEFEYQLCGDDPSDWTTFPVSGTNVSIQSFNPQADGLGFCIIVRLKNDPAVAITKNFLFLSCVSTAIELSNFDGQVKDDFNQLTWYTATESANKYFSLERSLDGVNFNEIAKIASQGNSNSIQSYEFNDYDLVNNAYYRLKATNTVGYSKIASNFILLTRFNNEITLVELSPIPASNVLNVNINSTEDENITVNILGINGKELISNSFDLSIGTNTLKLDISTYAAGIYFIQVQSDSKSIIEKFVID